MTGRILEGPRRERAIAEFIASLGDAAPSIHHEDRVDIRDTDAPIATWVKRHHHDTLARRREFRSNSKASRRARLNNVRK